VNHPDFRQPKRSADNSYKREKSGSVERDWTLFGDFALRLRQAELFALRRSVGQRTLDDSRWRCHRMRDSVYGI